jgi:phosphotransferase family enzyme
LLELERVGRGRNSRVYRVRTRSADYAAKFYFQKTADGRDRLQVEYEALSFLWNAGVRRIARPITEDRKRQVAVYAFIDGESVEPAAVGDTELDQLVSFAAELKQLSSRSVPSEISPAAEAFFTVNEVIRNVEGRLRRLLALDTAPRGHDALRDFLHDRFEPAFATLRQRARSPADPGRELSPGYRTLSPSDYGFHNTLRRPDGSLVFLDFEYFGWDDPAKLLSDLLLHPMMPLALGQRARLAQGMDAVFGADANWRARVEALYPLFGLKWCMIMLNEFLPRHIARNRFTERDSAEIEAVQARQLGAAAAMLARIMEEKDRFPFWSAATA